MPPILAPRAEQAEVDAPDEPGRLRPAFAAVVIAVLSALLWVSLAQLVMALF